MTDPAWHRHLHAFTEARTWCALQLDATRPAETLRTAALRPPGYPDEWMYGDLFADRVDALVARRSFLLAAAPPVAAPGRILCALGGLDLAMGEGAVESRSVIDDAFLPPWDTWFACVHAGDHPLLLAWIPAALEEHVQAAIAVAATDPIAWLTGPTPAVTDWQNIRDLLAGARATFA